MELTKTKSVRNPGRCGVPQCQTYRTAGIHLFGIPNNVTQDPNELNKWVKVLKINKNIPKRFLICSKHFRPEDILIRRKSKRTKPILVQRAFPCRNLPAEGKLKKFQWIDDLIAELNPKISELEAGISEEQNQLGNTKQTTLGGKHNHTEQSTHTEINPVLQNVGTIGNFVSIGTQCPPLSFNKEVQANVRRYISIISLWDTDKKLNTMTGIPTMAILDTLVEICQDIRQKENCIMPIKDRISLTMYKLKTNCSFAELAVFFQTSDRTAKLYFADTIQLLAKATKGFIHWQTKNENRRSMPKCFEKFHNVRTVLDCTEIKTATMNCLSCCECTYSHYKGIRTLKFLIGVSPSGLLNYISKVATGKSSDKAIFNLTDLIDKFEPGDAVVVDKGFMIEDEMVQAGIEMIRPQVFFEKFSKSDEENTNNIESARVHIERRILGIKQFRALGDKVCVSVIPYINDVVTVLCGLSNISPLILSDGRNPKYRST